MSELIVVTVIVAAEGGVKVPKITSREELTKALNKLGALRSEQVHLYICSLRVLLCVVGMFCVYTHVCANNNTSSTITLHVAVAEIAAFTCKALLLL